MEDCASYDVQKKLYSAGSAEGAIIMTTANTVRVGVMPGKIEEYSVEAGTTVEAVLELAGLDASGYDVKVDGEKVEYKHTVVTESTSLILLVKQVKGNSTVRVGVMPGKIEEYAVHVSSTITEVLATAQLDASGYDVKVDGTKVTNLDQQIGSASLVLLVKQVKGNSGTVRIGVMPGKIEEYAVSDSTTIAEALDMAGLDSSGYDVKVDGEKVTDLSRPVGSASLILLVKQVKGNAEVRVGVMPGKIDSYAVEAGTTIESLLSTAGLSASGYDVKVDGTKVTDLSQPVGSASLVLLVKQVKGNN